MEETGNPHGIPLLFIHGISQSRLCWRKQIHSDLGVDFRLITMDLRGHRQSEKPGFGYDDSRNWANDIQAVIESLHFLSASRAFPFLGECRPV
ncbi:alpha/beta fold hydrolase [Bacillus songklensis]|uniref:Alpha/beta fold hydrolase n=1 Tax=Bacillus songklensis TaxID=1069116 RepID=A0ABV8B7B5_9BACI